MRIKRQEFLQTLELVQPGLALKSGGIQQSSCFLFQKGTVSTFNGNVACWHPLKLNGLQGAVPGEALLKILHKLVDEELDLEIEDNKFIIKGVGTARLRMEKDIHSPIGEIDTPKTWVKLPEDFLDACNLTADCCGKNEKTDFGLSCVHLHPQFIESSDNFRVIRYRLQTGVKGPRFISGSVVKQLSLLGVTQMAETDTWLHFKNSQGLLIACRGYSFDWPDLKQLLKLEGIQAVLAKGVSDACSRAEVFSSEDKDSNDIRVELRRDRMSIVGVGVSGDYTEVKKVKYDGPAIAFIITPTLLMELVDKYNEVYVSERRLLVTGEKFRYVLPVGKLENSQ